MYMHMIRERNGDPQATDFAVASRDVTANDLLRSPSMTMDGGGAMLPLDAMEQLERLVDHRGPLLRLPEPAESYYLAEHRIAAVQWRTMLCLLPAFLLCLLALAADPLLGLPGGLSTSMRGVALGLVVPAAVISTAIVLAAPERPAAGTAVALNGLVVVVALEWLIGQSAVASHSLDHVIVACVPAALILFGGFRAACVVAIALGYLMTTLAIAAAFELPPHSALSWLGESILLLLLASTAIWMDSRQRRHWLMRRVIEHQAHRDPLTGLRNRRSFEKAFDMAASLARRERKNLCFAMIDLDHFKLINDRYGHAHGDSALRTVAGLLAQFERRPLDAVARLGGEEFGILLYDCNHAAALQRLHDLAQALHGSRICNDSAPHGCLTMSIGGTVSDGSGSLSMLLDEADRRLYEVKNQGRNGVRVSAMRKG